MKQRKTGAYSRRKGHDYERQIAAEFREMGWTEAATSRNTSRLADEQGIDLQHTAPFAVQCKCTAQHVQYSPILKTMQYKQGEYPVLFSKLTQKGEYVVLKKTHFYELLRMLKTEGVL